MSDYLGSGDENENEIYLGEYEGGRNEIGERHGEGRAVLPSGDVYQGSYFNGFRHGNGVYVFKKGGSRYIGNYDNNKKHGRGTFVYPDGSRYEGMWFDNERSGQGTYIYSNGDTYIGEWRRNKKHGEGVYRCASTKVQLKGTWQKGMLNGKGHIIHDDHTYEGSFTDNLPSGPGKYVFDKGFEQLGIYNIKKVRSYKEDDDQEIIRKVPVWKSLALLQTNQDN